MTTVTLPNATDAASFEADLDTVSNSTTAADYVISLANDITIATTDADIDPATQTQNVVIPTGSTLTLEGPGTLTITSPDQLVFAGQLTTDMPINGEVSVYSGLLINDPVTTSGSTPAGGIIDGSIASNQDGVTVQNFGQITGTGAAAVFVGDGLVVNASGGTITDAASGAYTIEFTAGPGDVENAGTISSTGGGFGAVYADGGTLKNGGFNQETTPAVLSGGMDGAIFIGAAGTITNDGAISSTGGDGAQFYEVAGTVTNGSSTDSAATIISTSATGSGISAASGTVTNYGAIQGGGYGVQFLGDTAADPGTVVNTGTISATDATGGAGADAAVVGVALVDGGTVTNGASGGTVASSATISGADEGVYVLSGTTTISNSGTISGTFGINISSGGNGNAVGTVIDSGAITSTAGAAGVAIQFGTGAERLVLNPGYVITGEVIGGAFTSTDTTALEVGAGTSGTFTGLAAGAGTLTNSANGFNFTNVQIVDVDSSASWAFNGTNSIATLRVAGTATVSGDLDVTTALDPAGAGGVISVTSGSVLELASATGSGDTIDLAGTGQLKIDTGSSFGSMTGSTYTGDVIGRFVVGTPTTPGSTIDAVNVSFSTASDSFNTSRNVLTVTDGTNTANISFTPGLFAPSDKFVLTTDGSGGTLISVACYCPGTRIATPDGEAEIETLSIGDLILTADGRAEPIRWIGRRSYAGRFLAANPKVYPIRFRKGSLGKGLPRRDLLVSPQHAMLIKGLLIPARCLVNGSSITIDHERDLVEYIHLELANHDVILAEGAASETFMDDDSRAMFQNAAEYAELYPTASEPSGFYARRVDSGYEVEAIRAKLAKMGERLVNRRAPRKIRAAA